MGPSFKTRLLLSVLSGVLVASAFPNFCEKNLCPTTAWIGWIALVPFFITLHDVTPKQGALLGWAFGFTQFGLILYWIAFLAEAQYLSGLAWLALVFYLSLYPLLFGGVYGYFCGVKRLSGVWVTPVLWVALEYIRGTRPLGGFPWGELGYTQAPFPCLLALTAWTGVYGLTFVMVLSNQLLAKIFQKSLCSRDQNFKKFVSVPRWAYLFIPLLLLALIFLYGQAAQKHSTSYKVGQAVLLQPNIDQSVKWSKAYETMTYDRIGRLVQDSWKNHPNLILWPETAAPDYLLQSFGPLERVQEIVKGSKTYHLVGCLDEEPNTLHGPDDYNAAIGFSPSGQVLAVYHKRHLVPFGEFVPFQEYLRFLGPVVGDLGDFAFGLEYKKINAGPFTYSPVICYEAIFPKDVRQAMATGADVLVNISNDAWYGRTASPYQHAMMAVMRAAEERKPLLRAANTGISLATDPWGNIIASSSIFTTSTIRAPVYLLKGAPTFYARFGDWLPRACCLITLVMFWISLRPMIRNKWFNNSLVKEAPLSETSNE